MAFAAMSFDVNEQLNQYLDEWKNDAPNENVIEILSKISEVIEKETETYYKMDPDPFDDRHPSRAKPTCSFGPLLKNLFKNDDFMNKLVNDYLMNRDDKELQIASCRLVLDILPGLETSVVFNDTDGLLERLLSWARSAEEPLQSYAIGLLAAAMDVQDIAAHSKEQNIQLMPIMIVKLKDLIKKSLSESNHIEDEEIPHQTPHKRRRISSPSNECSNSSWAEMEPLMIGSAKIFPLTNEISQRFIYQYLTSLGVYQDMLSFVFEHSVLSLILNTIDLNKNGDVRLAFDALKYLASLLCHKKFALEFVNAGGIQSLLKVNRQSVAANGVAYCLNCIAYHDDVMEKICFLPHHVLENLVSYALWLIETSHDSSRSNAMIFFSLSFSYRMILNLFDSQDGFRKIINEISMIDLFSSPSSTYSEDEIFTKRQWARLININVPPYKTINYDYELYMEHVEALLHLMPTRAQWRPVDDLIKFNGAKLLIQYISLSYDWNFTGKADAVRSALDVLVVCSVMAKFQALLGDSVVINEGHSTAGMRIILAAACGDIVNDADCQRSALNVIINCVCGPLTRPGNSTIRLSMSSSKKKSKCYDDVLKQMWTSVRFNNGIMILLNLMMIKTPITDADSIRTLSCKALCGLARSETVRQVMGKLPLFSNGQIQALLKEPILQDKRSEHIKFVKYCLELIASVTGAPVETTSLEDSVGNNLNKAEVITQTKIVFNEKELLQLIYKHLVEKGLSKTAQALVDEAKLTEFANSFAKNSSFSKFNTPPRALPRVYSGNLLYVGTDNGELHVFNYLTSEIETTFPCYDSIVSSIEPSWDGKMLLTSSYWDSPNSILWSVTESSLDQKLSFTHDNHVEFGKAVQDKVLGTAEFAAHLYSLGTGQLVRTFDDEDYANRYVKNIATFHPSDHLILNDGVLWDIRSEKPIHKFDKFNQHINGIFHPNGQEIISNSEIWDIKTYKLLNTVPALSGSHIKFNKRGNVIYGVYEDDSTEDLEEDKLPFSSSYRTFDGRDYSSIATIDVKRSITHLAIDPSDNYIAIIENQCNRDTSIFSHDKVARVYEIGKCREEDDEERDDDDEDEGDEESDGDSYDDDDDDIMADELMSDSSSNALDLTDMESEYETSNSSSISSDDESDEEIFYQLNN
ncbi:PREDICTED: protein VPRBP-like [Rhagoletis zephyria]|uniref:protein VPRBP-like n=1 Tax=Rhagoletis zephyria TaxID=28612 RepID=UPI00081183EF|nr:PREDICTED: protein VPRBP-like [Rhagoletis zephyria]